MNATRRQTTQAEVNAHVASAHRTLDNYFAADGGSPFDLNPNRFGWHARCKECGEGFTESGGANLSTLLRHGAGHRA